MFFGVGLKIGAAADVFLIEEDLRHGFNRFTHGFFQIGFSDAFRVDIHITEVEIITLFSQFLCQFFRAAAYWGNACGPALPASDARAVSLVEKRLAGSGVATEWRFWCALGALCFLFTRSLLQQRKHRK